MHVQLASVHLISIVSLTLTLILKIYQNYPKVLNCFVLKVLIINKTEIDLNMKLFIEMNNNKQQ